MLPTPRPHRSLPALALAWLTALVSSGAEIDSVTPRSAELRNSRRTMDTRLADFIRIGVERANERERGCDSDVLYHEIRRAISTPFVGHAIAESLNAAPDLDARRVSLQDSIYRDLGVLDAISVHLKDLSAVIRLDDHLVGVDKFGHFLVQGWKYFDLAYLKGDGIEAALEWGERSERTYFGLYTTGIYSYADLVANFDGMRFWLRLLGQETDPLETGYFFNRPLVTCGRRFWSRAPYWRVNRKVRLSRYVNGTWDEGSNCSRYRNPEIEARVRDRIAQREAEDATSYTCPIARESCVRGQRRYGAYANRLLHPLCAAVEAPPRPWWKCR